MDVGPGGAAGVTEKAELCILAALPEKERRESRKSAAITEIEISQRYHRSIR